jgi:predicted phage terminase large subunit-like protein
MTNPAYTTLFYAVDDNFGALWPDKWSSEALLERYREINDSVEFNRAFRNQAVDLDSAMVRSSWIQYSDLARNQEFLSRSEDLIYFTSYDVADEPTGVADQDYTASCTIAVDPASKRAYIVDAWHARLTLKEQAARVFSEWERYRPFRVLIEKAGLSTLAEWTLEEHPEMRGVIEIVRPRVSKSLRLMEVTPLLEGLQVLFAHHLDPDAPSWSPGRGSLPNELTDFPFGKHDDMVDAFTQGLTAARRYVLDAAAQARYTTEEEKRGKRKYKI